MSATRKKYVLITAAYNEAGYIGKTLESIVSQTLLPQRWVIVSDGSTDHTDEIVQSYAENHPFIRLVRIQEKHARNFGAQVMAINRGYEQLGGVDYDFIANLDADLTFEPNYYEKLLQKFDEHPRLGLAGGYIFEKEKDGVFRSRPMNGEHSVAHALQMLRREVYESVGGWVALPYGGPDWHLQVSVRMRGWDTRAFSDLPAYHHRPTGGADRPYRNRFREGRMDYSVGSYPPFEIVKLIRRIQFRPYVLGSLTRLCGFLWGYWLREERPVTKEFMAYLRREQKDALRSFLHLSPRRELLSNEANHSATARSDEISTGKPPVRHNA